MKQLPLSEVQPSSIRAYAKRWFGYVVLFWFVSACGMLYGLAIDSKLTAYVFLCAQIILVPGLGISKIAEIRNMWRGLEGNAYAEAIAATPTLIAAAVAIALIYWIA